MDDYFVLHGLDGGYIKVKQWNNILLLIIENKCFHIGNTSKADNN